MIVAELLHRMTNKSHITSWLVILKLSINVVSVASIFVSMCVFVIDSWGEYVDRELVVHLLAPSIRR